MKKLLGLLLVGALVFSPIFIPQAMATVNSIYTPATYSGPASGPFSFSFNIFAKSDIVVQIKDSTNTYYTMTLNVDYSVSTTVFPNNGYITLLPSGSWPTIPAGDTIIISRTLPLTQLISISDYSPTPASVWNQAFDRACMIEQQLNQSIIALNNLTGPAGPTGPQGPAGPSGPGTGDVLAPDTNTANYVPQWNGSNSKRLLDGVAIGNTANCLVKLDASGNYPAVNGSNITYVNATSLGGAVVGTSANNIVALDGSAKLPAVDGSQLTNLTSSAGHGQILNYTVFTSSDTWTKNANTTSVMVECVGGGGGGPGTGGGPGNGGTTSFGSICSATGGNYDSTGGAGSGGDINIDGGLPVATQNVSGIFKGHGGDSFYGHGGNVSTVGSLYGGGGGSSTIVGQLGGGGGGYCKKFISFEGNTTETITIGNGGNQGTGAGKGAKGVCIITEYK